MLFFSVDERYPAVEGQGEHKFVEVEKKFYLHLQVREAESQLKSLEVSQAQIPSIRLSVVRYPIVEGHSLHCLSTA